MSKKDQKNIKEEQEEEFTVDTPEGKLKVVNHFYVEAENRRLSFLQLEDETTIINVRRFEESETEPYGEEVTNQYMRLSKLTVAMLIVCLNKVNEDFNIDADTLIYELNETRKNERNS